MPTTEHTCPDDHNHGETSTCYINHGCRCPSCRTSRAEYSYWKRHMIRAGRQDAFTGALIDATGTRRRIQALMALGWSQGAIAAAASTDQNRVSSQLHADRVTRAGAAKIAAAYERLSFRIPATDTLGARMGVSRVRAIARRNNYAPPLAWDDIDTDPEPATAEPSAAVDDVAVDLAVHGHRVRLTPAERRACVVLLHAQRYSDGLIGDTIGCTSKTVERIRAELHLAAHDQNDVIDRSAAA